MGISLLIENNGLTFLAQSNDTKSRETLFPISLLPTSPSLVPMPKEEKTPYALLSLAVRLLLSVCLTLYLLSFLFGRFLDFDQVVLPDVGLL